MNLREIRRTEWESWSRIYRANFLNSLSGYKPALLIGTSNPQGQTNLALFSNIVHLGADPALVGYINRPRAATPHTLANIEATGSYTMNAIHPAIVAQAHQTSAKYPDHESEFDATGLTPYFRDTCVAPFVQQSLIQWQLQLVEIVPITHNNTFLVIGSVEAAYLPPALIGEDGFVRLDQAETLVSLGLDAYYQPSFLHRLPYARVPDQMRSEN